MREGVIGFAAGAAFVLLGAFVAQQVVIRTAAPDLNYRFIDCVFSDSKFPWGYLEQGRVVSRSLFPVHVTRTFYDGQYHEVTEAKMPGRYGAVVRIGLTGEVTQYRFVTLYRLPAEIHFGKGPMAVAALFPPGSGIAPAVFQNQGREIGEAIKVGFCGERDSSANLAILLAGLSETSPTDPPAVRRNDVFARDASWWFGLRQRLGLITVYPCLLDLPRGYDAGSGKLWPLILYLHSDAEKGTDLRLVRGSGLAGAIAAGRQVPAIVVSPQVPAGAEWSPQILLQILDEVGAKYHVDPDRVCLTGIGGGADMVWTLAQMQPERFAAIAPLAGVGDLADVARIRGVPAWTFVGANDEVISPDRVINMVNAVRRVGGRAHLTDYADAGHWKSWDLGYKTDALYSWLLAQRRGQPEIITPDVPLP